MIKQIAMMGILALVLVLVTAAVYTQSAFAVVGPGGGGFGGGNHGGQTPPGLATACANSNVQLHNQNCPKAG